MLTNTNFVFYPSLTWILTTLTSRTQTTVLPLSLLLIPRCEINILFVEDQKATSLWTLGRHKPVPWYQIEMVTLSLFVYPLVGDLNESTLSSGSRLYLKQVQCMNLPTPYQSLRRSAFYSLVACWLTLFVRLSPGSIPSSFTPRCYLGTLGTYDLTGFSSNQVCCLSILYQMCVKTRIPRLARMNVMSTPLNSWLLTGTIYNFG